MSNTNEITVVIRFPRYAENPSPLSHFDVHQAIINDLAPGLLQRVRDPGLDCIFRHQKNELVEIVFS